MRTLIGVAAPDPSGVRLTAVFRLTNTGEIQYEEHVSGTRSGVQFQFPGDPGWHHVVVVISASQATLYIDGRLKVSIASKIPQ